MWFCLMMNLSISLKTTARKIFFQVWALLDVVLILASIIAFTIETEPSFVQLMDEVSNVANVSNI